MRIIALTTAFAAGWTVGSVMHTASPAGLLATVLVACAAAGLLHWVLP
jgi:hypothetical protein